MKNYHSPHLERIVDRHLQHWELRNQVSRRRQEERQCTEQLGPYISISRLPYSLGDEVARRCSELLDWQLFDREIVNFIAKDAKTLGQIVESLDEKCRSAMDDWIQTALDGSSLGHLSYLRHLKRVVLTIALHGNAVILGRGAGFFLPPSAGLRVLITSPPAKRRQRLAEANHLSAAKATAALRRLDERRHDFIKTHFPTVTQEMDHHDLILNLDELDIEMCATVIIDAFYSLDRRDSAD